jgi:hypothetical protein
MPGSRQKERKRKRSPAAGTTMFFPVAVQREWLVRSTRRMKEGRYGQAQMM